MTNDERGDEDDETLMRLSHKGSPGYGRFTTSVESNFKERKKIRIEPERPAVGGEWETSLHREQARQFSFFVILEFFLARDWEPLGNHLVTTWRPDWAMYASSFWLLGGMSGSDSASLLFRRY